MTDWSSSRLPSLPLPLANPGCVLMANPLTTAREVVVTVGDYGYNEGGGTYILGLDTLVWRTAGITGVQVPSLSTY